MVASPTPSPQLNNTLTYRLAGLLAGTPYSIAITAVDSQGRESACSNVASAVARVDNGSTGGLVGSISSAGASWGSPLAIQVPVVTGLTAELGPQLPGTTVTFTAIAAEGTAPYQFKWWLWDGATWTVLGDWSTGDTLTWTPSTPSPNYTVGVRVRSAYSTADLPDSYPGNTKASRVLAFAIN